MDYHPHNFNHSPHVIATTCNDNNLCSKNCVDGIICSIVGDKDSQTKVCFRFTRSLYNPSHP